MRYFIDFEASQFAEEIISVGCVDESGRSFYSLVRPKKPKKVTDFITKLTGAQTALSLIIANIVDFSVELRKHFKMKRSIGLAKAVSYYRGEEVVQRHNSLDDAVYLREVFIKSRSEVIDKCPFDEDPPNCGEVVHTGKRSVMAMRDDFEITFASCGKAAEWLSQVQLKKKLTVKEKQSISNKISLAMEREKPYSGYVWRRNKQ